MASKQVEALAKRIKDEFGLEADPERFYRTYAGWNERAHGCATWIIYLKGAAYGLIGGFEPIRKYIVKRNKLDIGIASFKW